MHISIDLNPPGWEDTPDMWCDLCGPSYDEITVSNENEDGTWDVIATVGCTGGMSFYGDLEGAIKAVKEEAQNWPEFETDFRALVAAMEAHR